MLISYDLEHKDFLTPPPAAHGQRRQPFSFLSFVDQKAALMAAVALAALSQGAVGKGHAVLSKEEPAQQVKIEAQGRYSFGEFRKSPVPDESISHQFVDTSSFHKGKLSHQVLADGAPHLKGMVLHRVGAKSHKVTPYPADTTFYFGLTGNCTVVAETSCGKPSVAPLTDGISVLVRNGAPHKVTGLCDFASASITSGPWRTVHVRSPDAGMVPSPCGAGGISLLRMTNTSSLKAESTAHGKKDLLSKRVHLSHGRIPGLHRVSVVKFMPGAEYEEMHSSASQVYLHLKGKGCKLRTTEKDGVKSEHDLYPSHFDVLHPGTASKAWNDADGPCENLNLVLTDPAGELELF